MADAPSRRVGATSGPKGRTSSGPSVRVPPGRSRTWWPSGRRLPSRPGWRARSTHRHPRVVADVAGGRRDEGSIPCHRGRCLDIFTELTIFTDTVKKQETVTIGGAFEAWARDAIDSVPGVGVRVAPDTVLEIDGREHPIWIEVKRAVDAGSARLIAEQFRHERRPGIVVAQSMTESAREYLGSVGIGYIDARGNAHVRVPGILIHIAVPLDAQKREGAEVPARLSGKAGLVAQVLLLEDRGRHWQIGELAEATRGSNTPSGEGVSVGLVHKVLTRLENAGLVVSIRAGPHRRRMLANAAALLDLLAEEDRERHVRRIPAYVYSPISGPIAGMCSKRLGAAAVIHAVTGVAAASLAVSALTATPVTEIRITRDADPEAAMSALSARQVEQGANCVLVQAPTDTELVLRRQARETWLAAPTRIYLDAIHDPRRGEEQAAAYRREALSL